MNCENAREMISAAMDGELSGQEDALLREHLARCEECRRYARALSELSALLHDELPVPDESFTASVMEQLRTQQPSPRPVSSFPRRTLALVASLLLLVGVGFYANRASLPRYSSVAAPAAAEEPMMLSAAAESTADSALDSAEELSADSAGEPCREEVAAALPGGESEGGCADNTLSGAQDQGVAPQTEAAESAPAMPEEAAPALFGWAGNTGTDNGDTAMQNQTAAAEIGGGAPGAEEEYGEARSAKAPSAVLPSAAAASAGSSVMTGGGASDCLPCDAAEEYLADHDYGDYRAESAVWVETLPEYEPLLPDYAAPESGWVVYCSSPEGGMLALLCAEDGTIFGLVREIE